MKLYIFHKKLLKNVNTNYEVKAVVIVPSHSETSDKSERRQLLKRDAFPGLVTGRI